MVIDDHIAGNGRPSASPRPKDPEAPVVLQASDVTKSFWIRSGVFGRREFQAVSGGVNFQLRRGHTLGVVGESGSGKTMGPDAAAARAAHRRAAVIFDGRDLLDARAASKCPMRRRIQVFQNPTPR